jgi:hypothetical protein
MRSRCSITTTPRGAPPPTMRKQVEAELGSAGIGLSIAYSSMGQPDDREFCYDSRPHGGITARRQASVTCHPLTSPSRGVSMMAASICIA